MGGGFVPGGGLAGIVIDVEMWISLGLVFVQLIIKIVALIFALLFSAEAYVAADKLTKPTWIGILVAALVLQVVPLPGLTIFNLAGTVAACVFLADVRPALSGLRRR